MCLQGLELLVTVLLARNRQPPPTVAAGVPHAELAAELLTLPSGLLAMVCEAIVKLKVRLVGCVGDRRGADAVPTHAQRLQERSDRILSAGSTASSTARCRFPMWPDPAAIRSIRARVVAVRD